MSLRWEALSTGKVWCKLANSQRRQGTGGHEPEAGAAQGHIGPVGDTCPSPLLMAPIHIF